MNLKITQNCLLPFYFLFATLVVSGQAEFHLNKYVLVSGKERQQGAVYRFASGRTGIDAIVTIEKLTKSVSLDAMDFSKLGLYAAFQPEMSVAPHCWGEVQFSVQYVLAGTSTPAKVADLPAKRKTYNYKGDNSTDMKIYISKQSANSIKVILYMANFYGHTMTRKAEVYLHKSDNEKIIPETASIGYTHPEMGN